ncbi:G-D-S-L family lipolytic protein, partial [bacterium]|nr:G-D-S-L family lipolytic protein [bacterium]
MSMAIHVIGLLAVLAVAPVCSAEPPADRFALPAVEVGLPGEGALRRYEGYVIGWKTLREAWSRRHDRDRGAVVFLGDSITQGWGDDFRGQFPGMKAANRGIGGDTTRGMLIRLADDVLALDPAAIVILAGTNDIEVGIEPEAIARNVGRIIAAIKEHDGRSGRTTPIVLCRVFPSSATKQRPSETIQKLNRLLEDAVRGDRQVTLVDTWSLFADEAGDAQPAFFPDLLHLNPAGYEKWASALRPVLATLGFVETEADAFQPEEGFESLF